MPSSVSEEDISQELYGEQREPRFGESNPQRLDLAFWRFMVRSGWAAWDARLQFDPACREYSEKLAAINLPPPGEITGMSKEDQAALAARLPRYKYGGAVWSFSRFGQSETHLPDGSRVFIGGEHEDWYDPDFHIYNDVVAMRPDGAVEIYGYPRQVFRPTDFHTATLVGSAIYLIGCLGYWGTQPLGETPVYRLDCDTFAIETVATAGELPGWIYEHKAAYVPEHNAIRIHGGKVLLRFEGKRTRRQNRKPYWLDLATKRWTCGSWPGSS